MYLYLPEYAIKDNGNLLESMYYLQFAGFEESKIMEEVKTIEGKEFRELGYLQEVNRRFFHPLGLALSMIIDKEKKNTVAFQIIDSRDDEEGIYYALNDPKYSDDERLERFEKNKQFVEDEIAKRADKRKSLFGDIIEPIPTKSETK